MQTLAAVARRRTEATPPGRASVLGWVCLVMLVASSRRKRVVAVVVVAVVAVVVVAVVDTTVATCHRSASTDAATTPATMVATMQARKSSTEATWACGCAWLSAWLEGLSDTCYMMFLQDPGPVRCARLCMKPSLRLHGWSFALGLGAASEYGRKGSGP